MSPTRIKNGFWSFCMVILMISCKSEPKKAVVAEETRIDYVNEPKTDFDSRMDWWRKAKFGMFIHWGPYAVAGGIYNGQPVEGIGEWIMENGQIPIPEYEKLASAFNPMEFDAKSWAATMREAGIKYVVITSKHHDGFGLWDSKVSKYDMVDFSPYGKDVIKALAKACRDEGIRFGVYHSIMDWHHPQAQSVSYIKDEEGKLGPPNPEFPTYYESYLKPQIAELINGYDVDIMWFDGEWTPEFTHEQGLELYNYVRSLKPEIVVNNRVDKGRQGMQGMNKGDQQYAGDFGTPEQEILEGTSTMDWESCMTMNDTWGFKKNDHNWKSSQTLIHNLIDVVAKGGNYLLNVGPTPEGSIPAPSVERLMAMGKWLNTNGEAIYETEKLKNRYKQGENIRFTKQQGAPIYYAIFLDRPLAKVTIHGIEPEPNSTLTLLGSDVPLDWSFDPTSGLTINVPEQVLQTVGDTWAWSFKIQGSEYETPKTDKE